MKSSERHELQKNDLAEWLTNAIDRIRPYAWHIVGGIVIIILAIMLINMQLQSGERQQVESYQAFSSALNPQLPEDTLPEQALSIHVESLNQFLDGSYGSGQYGPIARSIKGDLLYQKALLGWASNEPTETVVASLEQARAAYQELKGDEGEINQARADYGLACTIRTLGRVKKDGELLEQGKKMLEQLALQYPGSPMASAAADRLDTLSDFRPLTLVAAQDSNIPLPDSLLNNDPFGLWGPGDGQSALPPSDAPLTPAPEAPEGNVEPAPEYGVAPPAADGAAAAEGEAAADDDGAGEGPAEMDAAEEE